MKRFLLFSLTVFGVAFAATLFPVQIQAQTVPTQCIADGLTEYMNTVLDGAGSLPNIKLLSPAFNLTNPAEAEIANLMVAGGARFSELDGFAGNTYTLNGVRAMEFFNSNGWGARFGGPWYFTEYGDFATGDTSPDDGSFERAATIASMHQDFMAAATSSSNIQGINYFNAFNTNTGWDWFELSSSELAQITDGPYKGKGGVNSATGFDNGDFVQRVNAEGLRWATEILNGPDTGAVTNSVDAAPVEIIVRLCVQQSCAFADPDDLVEFLIDLNGELSRPVYVIAGPNEPATERWATPSCAPTIDFDPTLYDYIPCSETRDDTDGNILYEYHSLRPYPTSPCDQTVYQETSLCGEDLVVREVFEFDRCIPPDQEGTCEFTIQSSAEISVDRAALEEPILGNTEDVPNRVSEADTIPFMTRMNEYVSWYLNGVVNRAEEQFFVAPEDQFALTDLSGPLRKLLPRPIQISRRNEQKDFAGDARHDQIIVCTDGGRPEECYIPLDAYKDRTYLSDIPDNPGTGRNAIIHSYAPYSVTEDLMGRFSVTPNGNALGDGVTLNSISYVDNPLAVNPRRLYFAHNAEVNSLSSLLQDTYIPRQYDNEASKMAGAPPSEEIDRLRSTEFCTPLDTRSNPGDNLYGNLARDNATEPFGTVTYDATFECFFPAATLNESQYNDCIFNATGGGAIPLDPIDEASCRSDALTVVETCEREILIPFNVEVATPRADSIWAKLVAGDFGFFKRIFPRFGDDVDWITPVEELIDIPGESQATYASENVGATGGTPLSNQAIAGDPFAGRGSGGSILFPHLGGIHEYFLRGVQCALRPQGFCPEPRLEGAPELPTDEEEPPVTPTGVNCDTTAPPPNLGAYAGRVMTKAQLQNYLDSGAQPFPDLVSIENLVLCYNDLVGRALARRVDPALAIAIWAEESWASNYEDLETYGLVPVADLGCAVGTPRNNFDAQADCFLGLRAAYTSASHWSYDTTQGMTCRDDGDQCLTYREFFLLFEGGRASCKANDYVLEPLFPQRISTWYRIASNGRSLNFSEVMSCAN